MLLQYNTNFHKGLLMFMHARLHDHQLSVYRDKWVAIVFTMVIVAGCLLMGSNFAYLGHNEPRFLVVGYFFIGTGLLVSGLSLGYFVSLFENDGHVFFQANQDGITLMPDMSGVSYDYDWYEIDRIVFANKEVSKVGSETRVSWNQILISFKSRDYYSDILERSRRGIYASAQDIDMVSVSFPKKELSTMLGQLKDIAPSSVVIEHCDIAKSNYNNRTTDFIGGLSFSDYLVRS